MFHFICYGWGGLQGRNSGGGQGGLDEKLGKNYGGMGVKIRILNMIMKETDRGDRGSSYFTTKFFGGMRGSVGL